MDARIKQLFEFMQEDYNPDSFDRQEFLNRFLQNKIMIDGVETMVWGDLTEESLLEWIDRWIDFKVLGERGWYDKYYKDFYNNDYTTEIDDLGLYLLGSSECKKVEVWRWVVTHYLPESSELFCSISHLFK